jgi:hypothetical protein
LMRKFRVGPTVALAVAAAMLSLTSCSGDEGEKNYTIPNKLCGTAIDPQLLEPLLPAGDTFSAEPWEPALPTCEISVDGERQGTVDVSSAGEPRDPVTYVEAARDPDEVSAWDVEDGGAVWFGDSLSGSMIAFRCEYDPGREYAYLDFDIGGGGQIGDEEEREERIKEFSVTFLEGFKQRMCPS